MPLPPLREALDRVLGTRLAYPVIAAVLVAVFLVNESTYRNTRGQLADGRALTQSRFQAMTALQRLTDAETAQRGFLITGRAEYLQPYEAARLELPQHLKPTLDYLAASGGAADADALRELIDTKLTEMSTTIDLHRKGQSREAFALVESDIGKSSMDQIRMRLDRAFEIGAQQRETARRAIDRSVELQRWAIHALTVCVALGLLAYMRRMAAEVRSREAERAALEQEVRARTADLRALAAYLQTVQERERERLSRELHDELGGLLTAAKLDLARAARATGPQQAAERLAQAGRRIEEVVGVKRRIIEDLRPSALEHLGLAKSLEILCRDVGKRLDLAVRTRIDDVTLTPEAQITVYRLVQEALNNVQKYARARHIEVTLTAREQAVDICVADDGEGFDATRSPRVGRHGLAGMRYRVEALDGQLSIRSAPGQGTRIEATLPREAALPAV
jgi:signal transduction histidine kinase